MLNVDGQDMDCLDAGEGPAVLFLPGSYSTTAAWRQVQRHLSPGYRLVTGSLCGGLFPGPILVRLALCLGLRQWLLQHAKGKRLLHQVGAFFLFVG